MTFKICKKKPEFLLNVKCFVFLDSLYVYVCVLEEDHDGPMVVSSLNNVFSLELRACGPQNLHFEIFD